jgi:hypothetical protein
VSNGGGSADNDVFDDIAVKRFQQSSEVGHGCG